MLKKLLKDFLRDIRRAIAAWTQTTRSGQIFRDRFKEEFGKALKKRDHR